MEGFYGRFHFLKGYRLNWVLILVFASGATIDVKSYKTERECNPPMIELSRSMLKVDPKIAVRCEYK